MTFSLAPVPPALAQYYDDMLQQTKSKLATIFTNIFIQRGKKNIAY